VFVALQDSKRGVGLQFGPDITRKFLQANNLKLVVRSHEVRQAASWGFGFLGGVSRV
jgi:hypothetical protein